MPRRWLPTVLLMSGCLGELDPRWLLQDDLRVLAIQTEVILEGPHSEGLLPIPADRTRSDPLPGDTLRVTPLIANADGIVGPDDLDIRWIACPDGSCLAVLRRQSVVSACTPEFSRAEEQACLAGAGPALDYVIPELDPGAPLDEQLRLHFLLAAGRDGRPTQECIDGLLADPRNGLESCLYGSRRLRLGPSPEVYGLALSEDIDLGELPTVFPASISVEQPNYSPKVDSIVLDPRGRAQRAWPGEPVPVRAGESLELELASNPRDRQQYIQFLGESLVSDAESVNISVWLDDGELDGTSVDLAITVPDRNFSLYLVVTDERSSQSWAVFDFEVEPR